MSCPNCHGAPERSVRMLLYWTMLMDDSFDELSPACLDVVDNYRPRWETLDEFREAMHDIPAIHDWMNKRKQFA